MEWNLLFFFNSALLGVGLAMDAFSVSLANGLNEPGMRRRKIGIIAGTFAFFQALMPMIGWVCVHTIVQYFRSFEKWIPWIALILLLFIGGKMLIEGIRHKDGDEEKPKVGPGALLVCAVIIAAVTFVICIGGLFIGRKFGTKFAGKASILGGVILIAIGIEIFVTGVF